MTQVGETLRRERVKRNLDFEQISRELKISTRFLEAIENDQYEKLPGGVFAKSFVRQYARLLGLDEEELATQLQGVIAPPLEPLLSPEKRPASVAPIQVPKVEEWQTVGDRGFRWTGSLSAAAMVVVVMLVCSAVYAWLQRPKATAATQAAAPVHTAPSPVAAQPVPPPPAPPAAQTTEPTQAAASTAVPVPAGEQKPVEAAAVAAKPAETKPLAPNPDATVHVQIVADEPVWISARADGKYTFSGTLNPGDTKSVEGVKDVVLRLGNAGGVSISLNGKPVGSVGPKGQTRTVQLTSGGFQIVPAKPPAAPIDPLDRL
uniref:Transcriptional regulator, XRE family n=1 Tax=Solibacter usitatus (strain Ellin6076) TaxID=234267 RepID=Q01SZ1_SOLUE